MKRKQLAAIMLSAIMAVSACVPGNSISVFAAENTGAESTGTSPVVEVVNEADESVTEAEAPGAQDLAEEAAEVPGMHGDSAEVTDESAEGEVEAEVPAEEEEETEAPEGEPAEKDPAADATEETPAAAEEEPATVDAAVEEEPAPGAATEEEPVPAGATAEKPADEAATAEDRSEQVIEEEAREEAGRPALRALQPEDFENAKEISAGDKKNGKVFRNNGYAVWKFTPDESGSYRFQSDANKHTYVILYDADHNEIAYDEGLWPGIERYFRKGATYYLEAGLWAPDLAGSPDLSASIRLDRLDMPDFYVEGDREFQIRVPYGKEAVLAVFAQSSTGKIYYKWKDQSGKIVGT